jgi:hypothetical protein
VICRLEDADYEGHSLAMLRRVAAALGKRVDIAGVRVLLNIFALSREAESGHSDHLEELVGIEARLAQN